MYLIIQDNPRELIAEEFDLADAISYGRNYAYDNQTAVVIRQEDEMEDPIRYIWPDGLVEVG